MLTVNFIADKNVKIGNKILNLRFEFIEVMFMTCVIIEKEVRFPNSKYEKKCVVAFSFNAIYLTTSTF
jgi:hypothetical protein